MDDKASKEQSKYDGDVLQIIINLTLVANYIVGQAKLMVYDVKNQDKRDKGEKIIDKLQGDLTRTKEQLIEVRDSHKTLSGEDCLTVVRDLAKSQGFYSNMINSFKKLEHRELKAIVDDWESRKFKSVADFVMFVETPEGD